MLRTNSKKYLENIRTYLINAIDSEGTEKEKISFLMECYNSEYNNPYNCSRYPNNQTRLENWLCGLPSAINIPFYYGDIIDLAKELQEVETYSKKTEETICKNYFNFIAYHILKLNNKLNSSIKTNCKKRELKEIENNNN